MLEEKLGGVVRVQYFKDAVPMISDWILPLLSGYVPDMDKTTVDAVAAAVVDKFKEELSDAAKAKYK